jgi:RNA polymerase sigma factor (sigma-70 family)
VTTRLAAGTEAAVVRAAADGDARAWERLVDAYIGLIWAIARNHGLRPGDAADVSQTTWLRLVENIRRIEDPARVGAWLATTARRECLRTLARNNRQVLVAETETLIDLRAEESPGLDAGLLARERDADVQVALAQLPPRYRELMNLLMLDPAP